MEINKKVVTQLSTALKVDEEKLTKAITDESIEKLDLNVEIMTSEEKIQFEKNVEKKGYDSGKIAGEEMLFKNFKKEKGSELEASNFNEFFEKYEENIKAKYTGDVDERLKEKEGTIEKLQKTIQDKDVEFNTKLATFENERKAEKVSNFINQQVSKLDFEIPKQIEALGEDEVGKFINTKLKQTAILFKEQIKVDFDENGNTIFKDVKGEVMVDNLQNPLTVDKVMPMFAENNYLSVSNGGRKGRGAGSSKTSGSLKGLSRDDMTKMLNDKKISGTSEGDALLRKWMDENKD